MKVAVLGAGIAGITTAYFLAADGHQVVVVERQRETAAETSYANGGVVGSTQVEPWAQPGLPMRLLGWIGREDAPLLLRLREVPHMYAWGFRFLRRCNAAAFRDGLGVNTRLTLYSLQIFDRLREELGMTGAEYDLNRCGALKVYFTPESFADAVKLSNVLINLGADVEPIDAQASVKLEPALEPKQANICGALRFPSEEIGDCRKFALWLAEVCRRRGVSFQYGTIVHGLSRQRDRVVAAETSAGSITADCFVVAQASQTPMVLRSVNIAVPIIPIKGVTVTVPASPWANAVRSAVMDHARLFGLYAYRRQVAHFGFCGDSRIRHGAVPSEMPGPYSQRSRAFPRFRGLPSD